MRRLLTVVVVAVGLSFPWVIGDGPDGAEPASTEANAEDRADRVLGSHADPIVAGPSTDATVPVIPIPKTSLDTLPGNDYWTFHGRGLPDDFVRRALSIDGVTAAFRYTAGTMDLVASHRADGSMIDSTTPGWSIPLDGAIVEVDHIVTYLGQDHGLTAGHVVLGERSAAWRGLQVGDTMTFASGSSLTVGAVVDDAVFGESEVIALSMDALDPDRFETRAAVIRFTGQVDDLREDLGAIYGVDAGFGLHRRHAHPDHGPRVVRSWVFMKETFGEFEYRPGTRGSVEIEPAWVENNIIEVELPLLGRTKCHRRYAHTLAAVMNRLIADGQEDVIDRSGFFGCWNPRFIRGTTRLSRHAFGIAADINFGHPTGDRRGSPTHSALLEAMAAYGVHSGHIWTLPDPGHFEYYGYPDGARTGGAPR